MIVGGAGVSNGVAAPEGQSWKDLILKEMNDDLDLDRVFLTGNIA